MMSSSAYPVQQLVDPTVVQDMEDVGLPKKDTKKWYCCTGCGQIFDKKSFLVHQRSHAHEFYHTKDPNGQIVCSICGDRFPTYNHFIVHWEYSFDHKNKALYDMRYRKKKDKKKGKWVVRPIHDYLIKRHIKTEKEKWVLRYHKDRTKLMCKEMMHGFEFNEMNVIEIVGPPGHGKSVVAIYLAVWMQVQGYLLYGYVPKIHIGHSYQDTQDFTVVARRGDIIIQDEDPAAAGGGEQWYKDNIENLMKTMRAMGIHYIFVSPRNIKYLWNQQFVLEAYARNFEQRVNKLALYDADQCALGWVYIPVLPDEDPVMVDYLDKKMSNIERLKREGGSYSVKVRQSKVEQDISSIFDFITTSPMYASVQVSSMSLDEIWGISEKLITGNTRYQKGIARAVQRMIKDYGPPERGAMGQMEPVVISKVSGDTEESTPMDLEIVDMELKPYVNSQDNRVLEKIEEYTRDATRTDIEKRGQLWWKYVYVQGMKQLGASQAINEDMGGDEKTRVAYINTFFPKFTKAPYLLGNGAELAIRDLYFPNCEHVSGKGQPDLVCDEFIVEVKARPIDDARSAAVIINEDDEDKYLKKVFARKEPVKVVIVRYGPEKCLVDIYDVVYHEESVMEVSENE